MPLDDSIGLQVCGRGTTPLPPPEEVQDADPAFGPGLKWFNDISA